MSGPLRISRAGRLGRVEFEAFGTTVTVLSSAAASAASVGLAARAGLTQVDLATGAGRARAADRLAAGALEVAGGGILVSVAHDVATAGTAPDGGWRVRIADLLSGAPTALVLPSGGMATFRAAGPGSPWRSVTVAAGSCREARAAAVSAASRADAPSWLNSLGLAGRLVDPEGSVAFTGRWTTDLAAA